MIENDIEEGLIIQPVERCGASWTLLSVWAFIGFCLILGATFLIHYLFDKKIWI
jgi:hypothetical protein